MSNKPWCVMPFNQMSLKESGRYSVCCEAKESDITVTDMTPLEFFHSEYMNDIRDSFAFGTPHSKLNDICRKCIGLEESGAISKRIKENENAKGDDIMHNYMHDEYFLDFIKFSAVGNKCNLKCIMCGPTSSSLIEKELRENVLTGYGEYDQYSIFTKDRIPTSFRKVKDKNKWLNDFKKILVNTKELQFSGGEPTIIPEVYDICNWIQNDPDLSHVKIHMNTNGMTANYKIKPLMEKGHKLELSISVDALGDKDEYIRFNTKWKTVERNIEAYLKLRDEYPNFRFMIQPTIQLLNIGYIHHLVDYCVERDIPIYVLNTVYTPTHFNPTGIPNKLKEYYLNKINSESKNLDKLTYVLKILNTKIEDYNALNLAFASLAMFDSTRNLDWKSMWPELKEYETPTKYIKL